MNKEFDTNSLEKEKITFFQKIILKWGKENFADFPWRHTKNRWHALSAEIMLQRTRADQVKPVYEEFCEKYSSPEDYPRDKKVNIFKSLGLIWRNKKFKKLAEELSDMEIPSDKTQLLKLSGVGDYIASAFRSLHLDIQDTIIDSNIVRLYGRFFGFKTDPETRRKKWFKILAKSLTPERSFKDYNYGLIDFTRTICTPIPHCAICPLNKECIYYSMTKKK